MESFFLAETTKYLYLLFDPDHFLNNNGGLGTIIDTPSGECIIDAGGYIFNTEAHPIDPSALRCCYDNSRHENLLSGYEELKSYKKSKKKNEKEGRDDSQIDPKIMSLSLDSNKKEWLEFFNLINSTFYSEIKKLDPETEEGSAGERNESASNATVEESTLEVSEESEIKVKSSDHSLNASKEKDPVNRSDYSQPTIKSYSEYPEIERKPFDEQRMIERLRELQNIDDENTEKNYELLTCKAQSFSQRLAVLGEILT